MLKLLMGSIHLLVILGKKRKEKRKENGIEREGA